MNRRAFLAGASAAAVAAALPSPVAAVAPEPGRLLFGDTIIWAWGTNDLYAPRTATEVMRAAATLRAAMERRGFAVSSILTVGQSAGQEP